LRGSTIHPLLHLKSGTFGVGLRTRRQTRTSQQKSTKRYRHQFLSHLRFLFGSRFAAQA